MILLEKGSIVPTIGTGNGGSYITEFGGSGSGSDGDSSAASGYGDGSSSHLNQDYGFGGGSGHGKGTIAGGSKIEIH